jgi:hypothetical protein
VDNTVASSIAGRIDTAESRAALEDSPVADDAGVGG